MNDKRVQLEIFIFQNLYSSPKCLKIPISANTPMLSGILQQRIELDKECMFQYTQLRKEVRLMDGQTSVAPVLMRFQRGCQQVGEDRVALLIIGWVFLCLNSLLCSRFLSLKKSENIVCIMGCIILLSHRVILIACLMRFPLKAHKKSFHSQLSDIHS